MGGEITYFPIAQLTAASPNSTLSQVPGAKAMALQGGEKPFAARRTNVCHANNMVPFGMLV